MTGNTQTPTRQQIKEELVIVLSGLHYVQDCFIEFDKNLNKDKIVIMLLDFEYDSNLRILLKKFYNCGHRIVFRQTPQIFPFNF